jgi:flagellar biosynthesis activator protein FlaF
MLTAKLYKALSASQMARIREREFDMNYASQAYAKTAKEVVAPRELEADLLLKATAKLQAAQDSWKERPQQLSDALLYNRRLWTVFLDSVIKDERRLPNALRENLKTLGAFVMCETFSLMSKPAPKHLASLIKINRRIAAGLSGRH